MIRPIYIDERGVSRLGAVAFVAGSVIFGIAFLWGMWVGGNDARLFAHHEKAVASACHQSGGAAVKMVDTGTIDCWYGPRGRTQ